MEVSARKYIEYPYVRNKPSFMRPQHTVTRKGLKYSYNNDDQMLNLTADGSGWMAM